MDLAPYRGRSLHDTETRVNAERRTQTAEFSGQGKVTQWRAAVLIPEVARLALLKKARLPRLAKTMEKAAEAG